MQDIPRFCDPALNVPLRLRLALHELATRLWKESLVVLLRRIFQLPDFSRGPLIESVASHLYLVPALAESLGP